MNGLTILGAFLMAFGVALLLSGVWDTEDGEQ